MKNEKELGMSNIEYVDWHWAHQYTFSLAISHAAKCVMIAKNIKTEY